MEKNLFGELPPEVWCYILTFFDITDNYGDTRELKIVNKMFKYEIDLLDPFKAVDKAIQISKDCVKYFTDRDVLYSLPREQLLHALQHQLIDRSRVGEIFCKTIIIGKENVGKTSFFNYFCRGFHQEDYEVTISCSFYSKRLVDPDQVATKFELWDTAGQERYRALAPMYYRGARAVLLCFSIDSRESVISLINNFLPEVVKVYGANPKANKSAERPVIYLVGLKSDRENARQVSTNEAKTIARALKLKYFECSAKLGQNVNEIMEQMKDDVLKTLRTQATRHTTNGGSSLVFDPMSVL